MTTRKPGAGTRDGNFPGTGIALVLPRVGSNTLSGMIEAVAAAPYNGRAEFSELAKTLQLDGEEVLQIGETLQLFRLAEIDGRAVRLTPDARTYAEGDVDQRKQMFARHLRVYVPLAAHIRRVLDERRNHIAPARRFRDELEDFMGEEAATTTLQAVIAWGRFAELFAYDEETDQFSLEDAV